MPQPARQLEGAAQVRIGRLQLALLEQEVAQVAVRIPLPLVIAKFGCTAKGLGQVQSSSIWMTTEDRQSAQAALDAAFPATVTLTARQFEGLLEALACQL